VATETTHFLMAQDLVAHAPYISDAVVELMEPVKADDARSEVQKRQERIEALLQARLRAGSNSATLPSIQAELKDLTKEVESPDKEEGGKHKKVGTLPRTQLTRPALAEAMNFITTGPTFELFLSSALRLVYSDALEAIKDELMRDNQDRARICSMEIEVSWELEAFWSQEIHDHFKNSPLAHLLVLCGRPERSYADSCELYMRWRWPKTYLDVLKALGPLRDSESILIPFLYVSARQIWRIFWELVHFSMCLINFGPLYGVSINDRAIIRGGSGTLLRASN
jgi:hypothetical protein